MMNKLQRKTYYPYDGWKPGVRDLTAKDAGRIAPKRLLRFAARGNPLRRSGAEWHAFVEDVRRRGVQNPAMVFVRPGREPYIDEGNHRVMAALEAKLTSMPVEIYYYGGAEKTKSFTGRRRPRPSR